VYAVQNRGHLISFEPPPLEVHRKVSEWFWDEEIFAWIGTHLDLLSGLTMRHYIRASELKKAEMDWLDVLMSEGFSPKTLFVAKLKADPTFVDENARIQAFSASGAGGRSTYFNHARKLKGSSRMQTAAIGLARPNRRGRPSLRVVGGT
jgi:hypothetical protein